MDQNRRRAPRADVAMLVQVRAPTFAAFVREHATNISSTGMFLRTTSPRALGEEILLQFTCGEGETLIEALGRVVHVTAEGADEPGLGIEFLALDDASRALVERIVEDNLEKRRGT